MINIPEYVRAILLEDLNRYLLGPQPGATIPTLQRRATYGGRKGRSAIRRLREMGAIG